MDSVTLSFDVLTTTPLRASPHVRRRKYGGRVILIEHNRQYVIDGLSDAVWLAVEDGLTVAEAAHRVQEATEYPPDRALASTLLTLARFSDAGLLDPGVVTAVSGPNREPAS